jgi:hypothetical protein
MSAGNTCTKGWSPHVSQGAVQPFFNLLNPALFILFNNVSHVSQKNHFGRPFIKQCTLVSDFSAKVIIP